MNGDKITVYTIGEFGMGVNAYEGRLVEHGTRKWAQYRAAPYVDFVPKRKRRAIRIQKSYKPYLLIVAGWGQPQPGGMWDETTSRVSGSGDGIVETKRSRYSSCDPRWAGDFNARIDVAIAAGEVEVVADYRAAQ